jgi:hypothetical protein
MAKKAPKKAAKKAPKKAAKKAPKKAVAKKKKVMLPPKKIAPKKATRRKATTKVYIAKARNAEYYWAVVRPNGRITATGETHSYKSNARRAFRDHVTSLSGKQSSYVFVDGPVPTKKRKAAAKKKAATKK